jgi:protocatechuate 3,4-dioxygenase alpha subunit
VYFPGDERNALDPVLTGLADAARESLIARLAEGAFTFDVVLQGEGQTAFFLPST